MAIITISSRGADFDTIRAAKGVSKSSVSPFSLCTCRPERIGSLAGHDEGCVCDLNLLFRLSENLFSTLSPQISNATIVPRDCLQLRARKEKNCHLLISLVVLIRRKKKKKTKPVNIFYIKYFLYRLSLVTFE